MSECQSNGRKSAVSRSHSTCEAIRLALAVILSIIVFASVGSLIYSYHLTTGSRDVMIMLFFPYQSLSNCSSASLISWMRVAVQSRPKMIEIS